MSGEDMFMYTCVGIIGLLLAFVVLFLVYQTLRFLYRLIFLQFSFGPIKSSKGKVTDMKYTPSRTTAVRGVVTRSPEKNEVFFVTKEKETNIDNDKLYQRVRVGEQISVHFQERFKKPRFWNGDWTTDGYDYSGSRPKPMRKFFLTIRNPYLGFDNDLFYV